MQARHSETFFAIAYGWDVISGNLSNSAFFFKWVGHFKRKFRTEGASFTNHCWCQKTRVITVSCGIKISAVRWLVLSQSTRVTDGQTDRRRNYDSQDRAIAACAVKTDDIEKTICSKVKVAEDIFKKKFFEVICMCYWLFWNSGQN